MRRAHCAKVFGEDADWSAKWGKKNGLFRQAATPDEPCLIEKLIGNRCGLRRGFICHTPEELVAAFSLLEVKPSEKAWICPVDCHEGRFSKTVWPLEKILPLITCNPANFLKLKGKPWRRGSRP